MGKAVAVLVALALAFTTLLIAAPAAHAAAPAGVKPSIKVNGTETYGVLPVLQEGDKVTMQFQYSSAVTAGSSFTVRLSPNVSLPTEFPENEAIHSVEPDGLGGLTITFKDPWPAGVNQGIFTFDVTVNETTNSSTQPITWEIGDEHGSVDVIIKKEGDEFAPVDDGAAKSVNTRTLRPYIAVGDDCTITLDPTVADHDITYTLSLDSTTARAAYSIKDVLPVGLDFIAESFSSTLTTWDDDGLNKATTPFPFVPTITGKTFSDTVNVPANSNLAISYKAKVSDIAALEAGLKAACEEKNGAVEDFTVTLTNTATFGGIDDKTANVNFRGRVVGVDTGTAFDKSADWVDPRSVTVDESNNLTPAQPIRYTLAADLSQWDDRSANYTLSRNVVIQDVLTEHSDWATGDSDFITAEGITLTKADACTSEEAFKADAFVGKYCVDGKKLLINLGKSKTTVAKIEVKALLTSVDGLPTVDGKTTVDGAVAYRLRNIAQFHHHDERHREKRWDSFPVVLPDSNEGHNDPSAFTKKAKYSQTSVSPGETVTAEYNIAVAEGTGIDMTTSTIVDYVDTAMFDLGPLANLPVTGSYNEVPLTRAHFDIEQDAAGNLLITLSPLGASVVAVEGLDKSFSVALMLTTFPFDGKETKTLKNRATIFGEHDTPIYWSEVTGDATSFGDEAEVRKRLLDPASGEWVPTLDAQIDVNGKLVRDVYTYRVEFIPHGSYNNVVISDVDDVLPSAVDFIGFVEPEDALAVSNPTSGPVTLAGNIEAVYENGVVKLRQIGSTVLQAGQPIAAYFAVRINDFTEPIVNKIDASEAIIVPKSPPSIDIEKWSAEAGDETPEYDAKGALTNDGFEGDFDAAPGKTVAADRALQINFTISNDGSEALKDIEVTDSLTGGDGIITDLTCTFPDGSTGTTWAGLFAPATQFGCTGTLPALKAGQTHSNTAKVVGTGVTSGNQVDDSDDWHGEVRNLPMTGYDSLAPMLTGALSLMLLGGGAMLFSLRSRRNA